MRAKTFIVALVASVFFSGSAYAQMVEIGGKKLQFSDVLSGISLEVKDGHSRVVNPFDTKIVKIVFAPASEWTNTDLAKRVWPISSMSLVMSSEVKQRGDIGGSFFTLRSDISVLSGGQFNFLGFHLRKHRFHAESRNGREMFKILHVFRRAIEETERSGFLSCVEMVGPWLFNVTQPVNATSLKEVGIRVGFIPHSAKIVSCPK